MTSGPEISASSAHTAAEKEEEVAGWRAGLETWRGGGLDGEVGVGGLGWESGGWRAGMEKWRVEGWDGEVEGGGLGWGSGGWKAGMGKWGVEGWDGEVEGLPDKPGAPPVVSSPWCRLEEAGLPARQCSVGSRRPDG